MAAPGLMMQMTRLSLNRMSSSDFSKASLNVRTRAQSVLTKKKESPSGNFLHVVNH